MKTRLCAEALLVFLTLTTITGCTMHSEKGDGVPFAGTRTSSDAADDTEKLSSEIYDAIGIRGKASDSRPGVMDCGDKDREKYFRVFHKWSFYPAAPNELAAVMERLREQLPKQGWKVVEYGEDTSANRNLNLTADNDGKMASVNIVHRAKNNPPKLSLMVVTGCYQVPDGAKVERF